MGLSDLLTPERVITDLQATDKTALLAELGRRAGSLLKMPAGTITEALESREQLGSTGLGRGFALPHARIEGLDRFFGMFVRLARPIPFDAIDDQPVSLVFLLLSPATSGSEHLAALAAISRRMSEADVVWRLRSASTAARLFADLVGGNGKQAA